MKQYYRTVAKLLLMLLLLMQLGNASAGLFTAAAGAPHHASTAHAQQAMHLPDDGAMPGHTVAPSTHTNHQGNTDSSPDGGCAAHCIAAGLTNIPVVEHVEPAPFLAVPFLPLHLSTPGPVRLERPPNLLS